MREFQLVTQAAVEAVATQHVYIIFSDESESDYFWLRATPGKTIQGPYPSAEIAFEAMNEAEGKPAGHFHKVFRVMAPKLSTAPWPLSA